MQHYGCPPNPICYGGALTACARCGMWDQVESLLNEMISLGLPLQESILISVVNVCRMSAISNSYSLNASYMNSSSSSNISPPIVLPLTSNQNLKDWTRAVWLVDKWAPLTVNLTESLFTMVSIQSFIFTLLSILYRLWNVVKTRINMKRFHLNNKITSKL
jgi:pentatricopeptide repeat protein